MQTHSVFRFGVILVFLSRLRVFLKPLWERRRASVKSVGVTAHYSEAATSWGAWAVALNCCYHSTVALLVCDLGWFLACILLGDQCEPTVTSRLFLACLSTQNRAEFPLSKRATQTNPVSFSRCHFICALLDAVVPWSPLMVTIAVSHAWAFSMFSLWEHDYLSVEV